MLGILLLGRQMHVDSPRLAGQQEQPSCQVPGYVSKKYEVDIVLRNDM